MLKHLVMDLTQGTGEESLASPAWATGHRVLPFPRKETHWGCRAEKPSPVLTKAVPDAVIWEGMGAGSGRKGAPQLLLASLTGSSSR